MLNKIVVITGFCIFLYISYVFSCNEAVCGSIVSKCLITQSCKCDLKNCSCCKDCFNCLSHLYTECCSCVEMCPKPNYSSSALGKKSSIEDLLQPIPSLFQSLISEGDTANRWITLQFPIDVDITAFKPEFRKLVQENNMQEVHPIKDIITLNCSVVYMSECMSFNQCKVTCQSMGATSFRWFHDGCCECVGDKCINYGIGESRCLHCPLQKEIISPDSADADYGEDEAPSSETQNSTVMS